jgi:hypothetical protein
VNWYDPELKRTYELYNAGDREGGMAACERLLSRPGLPPEIELLVRRNQTWHLPTLARAGQGSFNEPPYWKDQEIVVPAYVDGSGVLHNSSFNPSIAEVPGEHTYAIVRSSNYRIDAQGRYVINDDQLTGSSQTIISTVNHLLRLDHRTLEVQDLQRIHDDDHREDSPFPVRGHEDCRLYFDDVFGWAYTATVRDRSGELGMAQMIRTVLEIRGAKAYRTRLLSDQRRHEKNWMPWPSGWSEGPGYVYSVSPTVIIDPFFENPRRDRAIMRAAPHLLRHARGGTQVVHLDRGRWLCLVHESVSFDNGHRVYLHRFVAFDHDGRVCAYSSPFCFRGMGIEFAAGLVVREDEVIISYGVADERAFLLRVPIDQVLGMLHTVEEDELWCA